MKYFEKLFGSSKNVSTDKIFDNAISVILAIVFFLCPMFFSGTAFQGVGFEKMMLFYFLVLVGIVCWVSKGVLVGKLELKRTPLDWPILAFFLAYVAATFMSVNQKDSLLGAFGSPTKGLFAVVIFILFYYLIINNLTAARIRLFFGSFLASAVLILLYSFLQLLGVFALPFQFAKTQAFNPLGSITALSMFLVSVLPMLMIGFTQFKEIFPDIKAPLQYVMRGILALAAVFDLATLSILNNYTFWPAAMIGAVVLLLFFLSKIITTNRTGMAFLVGIFILLVAQFSLGNFNFANVRLPNEVSLSLKSSWNIAKQSVVKDPFFGSGPSTFAYSFAKYKDQQFNYTGIWNARFDAASGVLLELASTVGLLGALAALAIILIAATMSVMSLLKVETKEDRSLILGLTASFFIMLVYALFFTIDVSVTLIFFLVAVLAVAVSSQMVAGSKQKSVELSFRAAPQYALALAALFLSLSAGATVLFIMGFKMYLADMYAQRSIRAADLPQRVSNMAKAVQLASYRDSYYLALANDYLLLSDQEAKKGGNKEAIANYLSSAISIGRRAVEIAPNNVGNVESLALVYENASFYDQAALGFSEELYKKDAELDPTNPNPSLRLGLISMAKANLVEDSAQKQKFLNEAVKYYDEAISKKKDLAAAYYSKAVALEKLSKNDDSIEQLKLAAGISNSIDYTFELGRMYYNRGLGQSNVVAPPTPTIPVSNGTSTTETPIVITPPQNPGQVIKKNQDLELAERIFGAIITANPNHANSLYGLTLLYKKVGEDDKARETLNKLLSILPDEQTKQNVREQFNDLQ